MTQTQQVNNGIDVPDFYAYAAAPLAAVEHHGDFIHLSWGDGQRLHCHRFWLRENALGLGGIDPATREGLLDPADLSDAMRIAAADLTDQGDLSLLWQPEAQRCIYHGGWLRHIADCQHLPESWIPKPEAWDAQILPQPPRRSTSGALESDRELCEVMNDLIRYGVCVLESAPSEEGFLNKLAARIGPVRDSNFGALWDVVADISLAGDAKTNTTANTGLRLGPHTDLPTREIPPGYQFLHCLIN